MKESLPNQSELQTFHRRAEEMFGHLYSENKALFDELPKVAPLKKVMVFLDSVEMGMDFETSEGGKTEEEVLRSAIVSLSKEGRLWLITPKQFASLPDGTELTNIFGKQIIKGKDVVHLDDVRGGWLSVGFLEGAEVPDGLSLRKEFGPYFID